MKRIYQDYVTEKFNDSGELIDFRFEIPDNFNFAYDVADRLAVEKPEKIALVWCDDAGNEKIISFRQLKEESDRTAAFLIGYGIKKGDKVMLILKRHYEFWYFILALHKIGAVCVPATNQLMTADLIYRFNSAGIKAIICTSDGNISDSVEHACAECPLVTLKIIVRGEKKGWVSYDNEIKNAGVFIRPTGKDAPVNSDMMLLYFSSGTTGMPKMVAHDYTYPLGHIPTAIYWHNVQQDGLHFTVSETGWAKSVWGKLYGQWLGESSVFVYDYERFNAEELINNISKYNVTTFCAPPTIFRFLIKEDLSKYDLSSLKHTTIAGEALNPEVYQKFLEQTGCKLMEAYGQTEMTVAVATFKWMEPKPGSMGKPSPAYNIDIVDERGNAVGVGIPGEIVVRVDNIKPTGMFLEYYKDEHMTKKSWHENLYHTGDVAWRDEDGYFWYVGRTDDMIKSSGYRIGPFEVESVIMEHNSVLECAVTGTPDPIRGQLVKATIVLAKGYKPCEELKKEIQDYVKTHTAPYKYPRIIEFVTELPKTISGKIRRADIRKSDFSENTN